jgi:methyl-accepting chemotaxis protein
MAPNLAAGPAGRQAAESAGTDYFDRMPLFHPSLPLPAALQTPAGWVGPTMALALVVIALVSVCSLGLAVLALKKAADGSQAVARELAALRAELEPTVRDVRAMAESGRALAGRLQDEVREVVRTSQRVRHDVERGLRRARRRLADLDALAEVVQSEVEDTALDVAATLRTLRRGKGVIGRIRRLLRGRR